MAPKSTHTKLIDSLWGTNGFRVVITILVLSMHPIGRGLLSSVGFQFPDEKQLNGAAEIAQAVKHEVFAIQRSVDTLTDDINELKRDGANTRANYAILNTKLDKLSTDFTGFQVDFRNYKDHEKVVR